MGMSASQARLLSITARINDIEYKSQNISNTKIRLADESEEAATNYTKALNKTKLVYTDMSSGHANKITLNSTNLQNELVSSNFRLVDAQGNPVSLYSTNNKTGMKFTEAELYEMIESGQFMLQSKSKITESELYEMIESGQYITGNLVNDPDGYYKWSDTSVSGNNQLTIESDTTELAKAEAEYNAVTAKINKKEKLLDNDLKALDTEHNALKTEFDSVKSLIGDNVEKSFNLFS